MPVLDRLRGDTSTLPMRVPALLALLCLALPARTDAQRSGLLLGLASDSINTYRTLWIAPVDGRMAVAATHDGIVVPRDSGFWRATIVHGCGVSYRAWFSGDTATPPDSSAFLDEFDQLVRHRLGQAPQLAYEPIDCHDAYLQVVRDSVDDETDYCHLRHERITHVSPRFVSTRWGSQTTEFCEPGSYRESEGNDVVDWDEQPVSLLERMPAARARWLVAEFERQKGDCSAQDSPDEAWGIERALGGWKATFRTYGATVCRGESGGDVTTTIAVPASLARRDDAATWLPALRKAHGKVWDVFTSPSRDLVAAMIGRRLVVHAPKGGVLGPVVLSVTLDRGYTPVMVEWATGTHVDRWTRELSR
jgi:hypothetical protein